MGASCADPDKFSLAHLPYEIQKAIFEAATGPQIFFVEATSTGLIVSDPAYKGLAQTCRLSREIFLKYKPTLCKFKGNKCWADLCHDIFYLHADYQSPPHFVSRHSPQSNPFDRFDRSMMTNIAVDLHYLGQHPRRDATERLWVIFPSMRKLHVFVPKGPPHTEAPIYTPETLALADLADSAVVAPANQDKELWWAVKYNLKRGCFRIESENGSRERNANIVFGHVATTRKMIDHHPRD
ncbi:hypothetical protein B0T17DRAFT_250872 [Bombardia bombarda]|uniref:Uncharacterized protein n=1 Tax=Bombardia bombarda TaxID=252184 RepID=A0AA39WZW8_9PEZI|nr:hypothetical protein B0T17DRAFT_250872 [Bombardia bombarda]